jgi:ATP-binding cassette subfamily C (CFTR/MRP) protein 4
MDDKHPPAAIEHASILSYITFNWIQPMLLRGRVQFSCRSATPAHPQVPKDLFTKRHCFLTHVQKQTLVADDLQRLSENDKVQRIADLMFHEWTREVETKKQASIERNERMKRPNLFKVLWRCFGLYACVPFVSGLMESVCKISEAVLLG